MPLLSFPAVTLELHPLEPMLIRRLPGRALQYCPPEQSVIKKQYRGPDHAPGYNQTPAALACPTPNIFSEGTQSRSVSISTFCDDVSRRGDTSYKAYVSRTNLPSRNPAGVVSYQGWSLPLSKRVRPLTVLPVPRAS